MSVPARRRAAAPGRRRSAVWPYHVPTLAAAGVLGLSTVVDAGVGWPPGSGPELLLAAAALALAARAARALAGCHADAAEESERHEDERAALLRQVVVEANQSRRALLAELHDGPLQQMVLAAMSLELALDETDPDAPGRDEAQAALDRLHQAITDVRAVLVSRGAPARTDEGLSAALRRIVDAHATAFPAGVSVLAAVDRELPAPVADAAFLVAREAVVNAAKHADADTLTVTAAASDEALLVTVADDGVGVSPATISDARADGHVGMTLIAERAAAVGGVAEVRSGAGQGTVVEIRVPLPSAAHRPVRRFQLRSRAGSAHGSTSGVGAVVGRTLPGLLAKAALTCVVLAGVGTTVAVTAPSLAAAVDHAYSTPAAPAPSATRAGRAPGSPAAATSSTGPSAAGPATTTGPAATPANGAPGSPQASSTSPASSTPGAPTSAPATGRSAAVPGSGSVPGSMPGPGPAEKLGCAVVGTLLAGTGGHLPHPLAPACPPRSH